ncbi:MAG: hypothetical protein GVY12_17305 [Bacteroidetes bacterium]|nr:hypothetical protein [Bacteroidota bacterium]
MLALPSAAALSTAAALSGADDPVAERLQSLSAFDADEVLWLARCIYSESNRPHEQELVAWVVRNRVETGFRGGSYRDVVLEDRQFSAFNRPSTRRSHILQLDAHSRAPGWQTALTIALDVFEAPAAARPFAQTTRHFYSPVSMRSRRKPHWAEEATPLPADALGVTSHRFQFFDGIDADAPALAEGPVRPYSRTEAAGARRTVDARTLRARMRARSSGRVARPASPGVRQVSRPNRP